MFSEGERERKKGGGKTGGVLRVKRRVGLREKGGREWHERLRRR